MSLLDIEENEVKTKVNPSELLKIGFLWSIRLQAMKYCNNGPYIPAMNSKHAMWSIIFWDKGFDFHGKKLRMNRVLYRVPKIKHDGTIIFEKKVIRNITMQNLKILITCVNNTWDEFAG